VKFSVLLPTRNRLDLLRYAVESVRKQDYQDWEIVVSDNDSEEGIEGYVRELADPRIIYVRTEKFVPVTDNWNNALRYSTGEYVVMLGDDDCLLPGYFSALVRSIEVYGQPDAIYVEAVQYAYPGVISGHEAGFVQQGYCEFMLGRTQPFVLDPAEARRAVEKSMALKLSFSFNMQHVLVSRRTIDALASHGPFYQSPYPDYYASNVVLLTAPKVVAMPEPLVAIGISPHSFGYFYFNERESEGVAFLNNLGPSSIPESVRDKLLPGSTLLTSWYLAMACIEQNFGREYGVHADSERYRYLQVLPLNRPIRPLRSLRDHWRKLSTGERLRFGLKLAFFQLVPPFMPGRMRARYVERFLRRVSPFPKFDPRIRTVEYRTILELFEDWPRARAAFGE
jgi:glycosyltransferase involved in cell wall biosynthesis